jgi:hypothetical protein
MASHPRKQEIFLLITRKTLDTNVLPPYQNQATRYTAPGDLKPFLLATEIINDDS